MELKVLLLSIIGAKYLWVCWVYISILDGHYETVVLESSSSKNTRIQIKTDI